MTVRGDVVYEPVYDLEADFLVRFLPALKPQLHPDLHIVAEELDGLVEFGFQVVRIDGRRDLQLFQPPGRLGLLRILVTFGLVVEELSVIHDLTHWWSSIGGDFYQVKPPALGDTQRIVQRHDPELIFRLVEDADFSSANLTVPAVQRLP